jgi:hypothetical protein
MFNPPTKKERENMSNERTEGAGWRDLPTLDLLEVVADYLDAMEDEAWDLGEGGEVLRSAARVIGERVQRDRAFFLPSPQVARVLAHKRPSVGAGR